MHELNGRRRKYKKKKREEGKNSREWVYAIASSILTFLSPFHPLIPCLPLWLLIPVLCIAKGNISEWRKVRRISAPFLREREREREREKLRRKILFMRVQNLNFGIFR